MKKTFIFILSLSVLTSLYALEYTLITDYCFLHRREHFLLGGKFMSVAAGNIGKQRVRDSKLYYEEESAYPHKDEVLSFGFGYNYMKLNFKKKPKFDQEYFNNNLFSAGYITTTIENRKWVPNLRIQTNNTEMLREWVSYCKSLGFHIDFMEQTIVKTTYFFPTLDFDRYLHSQWKINTAFPPDFSLHYFFAEKWSAALSYQNFDEWYRSSHRVSPNEKNPNAIISLDANGLDCGVYLTTRYFSAGIFAGVNLGGWISIRNRQGDKPIYFHYDIAPYGGIRSSFEF